MLKHFKNLFHDSMIYGLAGVLSQIISFFLLPLYTYYLSTQDFGIIALLTVVGSYMSVFSQLGLIHTLFRFYYMDEYDKNKVVDSCLITVSSLTILIYFLAYVFSANILSLLAIEPTPQNIKLLHIKALSVSILSISLVFINMMRAERKAITVSILSTTKLLIIISFNILFVVIIEMGVIGILYSELIGGIFYLIASLIVLRKNIGFDFHFATLKDMLIYSAPLVPTFLLAQTREAASKYFVNKLVNMSELGLYSVGERFQMPAKTIYQALNSGYNAIKFEVMAKDMRRADFFRASFTYIMTVMLYLWLGISIWSPEFIIALVNPDFIESVKYVTPLTFLIVLECALLFISSGVQAGRNQSPMILSSATSVVVLVGFSFLLFPSLAVMGIVYATILARLSLIIVAYPFAQRRMYVKYNISAIIILNIIAFGLINISHYFIGSAIISRLAINISISLLYPFISYIILGFYRIEKNQMNLLWSLILRKIRILLLQNRRG